MNRNQESIEQLKRLTQSAKNFYGNNYSPGFISHRNDTKHYLGEEYIPYDWGDDIDNPVNDEYKKVYMNKKPNYDFLPKPQTQKIQPKTLSTGLMPKQKLKGFGDYMAENIADMAYGTDRAISGATFGGYDWLKRKTGLGVNERDYLNMKRYNDGTDKFAKIGGNIAQYGAEALSTGYGLYKGVQGIDNAITGYTRYNQLKVCGSKLPVRRCWIKWIRCLSTNAASAERTPTTKLSIRMNWFWAICFSRQQMKRSSRFFSFLSVSIIP